MFPPKRLVPWIAGLALLLTSVSCENSATTSVSPSDVPKCQVAVTGGQSAFDAAGGIGAVTVSAAPECGWTALAAANWISGLTPASGQGAGEIKFHVAPNPTSGARQAEISVNNVTGRITQAGAACPFELTPKSRSISASAGTGTLAVATPSGCSWTVTSNAPWLTASTATASGTGPGTVTFSAAENTGDTRSATLTIGDQIFLVTQSAPGTAPCSYVMEPDEVSIAPAGGRTTVSVQTGAGCSWSGSTDASWLTVEGPVSRNGGGTITVRVSANTGASRTGSVTIADQILTVKQGGADEGAPECAYGLDPSSQSMTAAGGSTSFSVQTGANCSWSATSNVSWLTVGADTGVGSSDVSVVVAANTGAARTGAIRIATRTFSVSQAASGSQPAPCSYAIDPTALTFPHDPKTSDPVSITTTTGCAWTATSNDDWISVETGAQGTGTGTMTFSVSRNKGKERVGTLTIAGHTLTVTQKK
jgi:hypothetical protein